MEYAKDRFVVHSKDITDSILHMKKYKIGGDWFDDLEVVVVLKEDTFGNKEGHIFHNIGEDLKQYKYNLPSLENYEDTCKILIKKHLYNILKNIIIDNKELHLDTYEQMLSSAWRGTGRFKESDYVL